MEWTNLNYVICVHVYECHMMERCFACNDPEVERTMNGTCFLGVVVFILINLADLILRYWRQNITIRVFVCFASNNAV